MSLPKQMMSYSVSLTFDGAASILQKKSLEKQSLEKQCIAMHCYRHIFAGLSIALEE